MGGGAEARMPVPALLAPRGGLQFALHTQPRASLTHCLLSQPLSHLLLPSLVPRAHSFPSLFRCLHPIFVFQLLCL